MEELKRSIVEAIAKGLEDQYASAAESVAEDIEGHPDAMAAVETLADVLTTMGY